MLERLWRRSACSRGEELAPKIFHWVRYVRPQHFDSIAVACCTHTFDLLKSGGKELTIDLEAGNRGGFVA
jgi:hypothetical protein